MTESLTALHPRHASIVPTAELSKIYAHDGIRSNAAWLLVTIAVLGAACQLRWSLVTSLPWQCDELPVLMRNTGVAGYAANEAEARRFTPSRFTAYKGAIRSLRSRGTGAQHVTTNFWTNLTVHLFGCTPTAGRIAPLFWSIVTVFGVGWAAWMVSGRLAAACLAGWVVALSPHAVAYGAQARGYAEALALTPLLIIAIEFLRRRPDRKLYGIAVFLCALQLSLTFYTMWIYWVFPAIVIMVLVLPRSVDDHTDRRIFGAVAVSLAIGLCAALTVFTIDRWDKLTFVAWYIASTIEPGATVLNRVGIFIDTLADRLLPFATGITLIALAGIPILWRSLTRWWLLIMAAGVVVPVLFAMANGTAGYTRTFGYLIAPIAILFGLGADALIRAIQARLRFRQVGAVAAAMLLASTVWAYPNTKLRARTILLPDWGELVLAVNEEPQSNGPRWFCHCRANYWQIRWYQQPLDASAFLSMEAGSTIEVVMGAQLNDEGEPIVYRLDHVDATIRAAALPEFLAGIPPSEVRSGIEVRRWVGTKLNHLGKAGSAYPLGQAGATNPSRERKRPVAGPGAGSGAGLVAGPRAGAWGSDGRDRTSHPASQESMALFVLIAEAEPFTFDQWQRFLERTNGVAEGIVTFKTSLHGTRAIESLIAPAHLLQTIRATLLDDLGIPAEGIHAFSISPIPSFIAVNQYRDR